MKFTNNRHIRHINNIDWRGLISQLLGSEYVKDLTIHQRFALYRLSISSTMPDERNFSDWFFAQELYEATKYMWEGQSYDDFFEEALKKYRGCKKAVVDENGVEWDIVEPEFAWWLVMAVLCDKDFIKS